jgi:hypothetical protein
MKFAEKIIVQEIRESLWKHVAKLEEENSQMMATAMELQGRLIAPLRLLPCCSALWMLGLRTMIC